MMTTMSVPAANPYMCAQTTTYSQYDENLLIPAIPAPHAAVTALVATSPPAPVVMLAPMSNAFDLGTYAHGHVSHATHLYGHGKISESEWKEMPAPFGVYDSIMAEAVKKCLSEWKHIHKTLSHLITKINGSNLVESKSAYQEWMKQPACDQYSYMLNKTYVNGEMISQTCDSHVRIRDAMAEILNSLIDVIHLKEVFEYQTHLKDAEERLVKQPQKINKKMKELIEQRVQETTELNKQNNKHTEDTHFEYGKLQQLRNEKTGSSDQPDTPKQKFEDAGDQIPIPLPGGPADDGN